MKIIPDPIVRTDGAFEIDDQFNDGYLTIYAGGYDGYVRLNRAQVAQAIVHLALLVDMGVVMPRDTP